MKKFTICTILALIIILTNVKEKEDNYLLELNIDLGQGKGKLTQFISCDKPEVLPKTKGEFKLLFGACWNDSEAKKIFVPTIEDKTKFPIGEEID